MMLSIRLGILGAVIGLLPATAQDSETKNKPPRATASLVPVGSNSDAYWTGEGPSIRAVAIDPGATPPSTLAIETKDELVTIPTILNRPTPALPVSGETVRIYASTSMSENEELPLFADFKIPPASGHYDIFMARAADQPDWDKPTSLVVPSTPLTFPAGSIRLINLDNRPIRVQIGKSTTDVLPGRVKVVPDSDLPNTKLLPVRAANSSEAGPLWIMRTGVRYSRADRTNIVFYPSRKKGEASKATWYAQY